MNVVLIPSLCAHFRLSFIIFYRWVFILIAAKKKKKNQKNGSKQQQNQYFSLCFLKDRKMVPVIY